MLLSIVIPVYNEVDALPALVSSLKATLVKSDIVYEVVFVDDGSSDGSVDLLKEMTEQDRRIRALFFSRNFGHQAAITAGIDFATGDAIVVMDADLQDPPELLPEMMTLLQMGYDVVSAQRITRSGDSALKRKSAAFFYWIMRKTVDERIRPEVGDFRMFNRRAIVAIRQLREQHRFMRGMVAWLGLQEVIIPFHRHARVAGETKYPLWKMLKFAWTAISSFSALPLRASILVGLLVTACGVGYGGYIFAAWMLNMTVPGWTSLVCLNIVFSGTTMVAVGLVGEYVARIYEEAKGRPLYVVSGSANLPIDLATVEKAIILPERRTNQEPTYRASTHEAVTRAS
jgi:glycosyltransferase involved in cell wall biosynthesis